MKIRCAICNRQVDEVRIYPDPRNSRILITAFCHGKAQGMELAYFDMARMSDAALRNLEVADGVAFEEERLISHAR